SGLGSWSLSHFSLIVFQKASFSAVTFGAYIARTLITRSLCHGTCTRIALPGMISVASTSVVLVISLFRITATPLAFGLWWSMVWCILILLLNRLCRWSTWLSSRCVSCATRIPIFLSLIIWLM